MTWRAWLHPGAHRPAPSPLSPPSPPSLSLAKARELQRERGQYEQRERGIVQMSISELRGRLLAGRERCGLIALRAEAGRREEQKQCAGGAGES